LIHLPWKELYQSTLKKGVSYGRLPLKILTSPTYQHLRGQTEITDAALEATKVVALEVTVAALEVTVAALE